MPTRTTVKPTKITIHARHGSTVSVGHDAYQRRYTLEVYSEWDNPKSRIVDLDPDQFDLLARTIARMVPPVGPDPAKGLALLFGLPEVTQ